MRTKATFRLKGRVTPGMFSHERVFSVEGADGQTIYVIVPDTETSRSGMANSTAQSRSRGALGRVLAGERSPGEPVETGQSVWVPEAGSHPRVILSNSAIVEALNDGRLIIEPEPDRRAEDSDRRSATSAIDLRLGSGDREAEGRTARRGGLGRSGRALPTHSVPSWMSSRWAMAATFSNQGPDNLICSATRWKR